MLGRSPGPACPADPGRAPLGPRPPAGALRRLRPDGAALAASLALGTLLAAGPGSPATAQTVDSERLGALDFRHIGPVGNRIVDAVGVPGRPGLYYAGAASGGVWKSEDGGVRWEPVFDDQPVHSIGAIAVAPSDPNVVWVGTGEPFIRSNVSVGNGVWRSTDAGESWTHVGLEGTGRISRIVVHPEDPDRAWVAALGHGYAPQPERGVYRTTDGGETWEKVLFIDEETGVSDLLVHPTNPRVLFAGAWQLSLRPWNRTSGGPGSGLFVSRDGGDTWTRLEGNGLPRPPVGKIGLCTTPADPDRIYALIETGDGIRDVYAHVPGGEAVASGGREPGNGELWRSDDGGRTWELVSHSHDLAGRTAYYTRCAVAPDDPDEVYFLQADYAKSVDGGRTVEVAGFGEGPNWDHHNMWVDPRDPSRMIVSGDGGVSISRDRGEHWYRSQLPVAQLYHVTVDDRVPYYVYTNRQDGPSLRGPSRSRTGGLFGGGIPRGMWHEVGGGESGFATPDTVNPDIVWSSTSGYGPVSGIVVRYDQRNRQFRNVEVWPESNVGWPAEDVRYRWQWTFPLLISPHDHETVYVGSQHVHRSTDGGQSWEVISPDLTTADTSKMGPSGGLTPDNIEVEYCCVVYALDESPAEEGVLWAGTHDGLVHVSRDGGETWTEVTGNIPDLPPWGTVRNVDASRWAAGKAYLTVDRHMVGDFAPHVYRTEDFGASWTKITDGIPESPLSFARNVIEDPVREGLLYLGTENALYVSFDDGGRWQPLMTDLPPAPVYWLQVQPRFRDLVVGTYGRGIWILDDVTPLQQLTPEVAASDAHLFDPRPAWRFRPITPEMSMFDDPSAGEDPPYGASLNYWLGAAVAGSGTDAASGARGGSAGQGDGGGGPGGADSAAVAIHVLDSAGDTVRTLEGTRRPGLNRVWWDLESEPTTEMKLRTPPPGAAWVEPGDDGWRSSPAGGRFSVLSPPGAYTIALEVDGEERGRASLEVLKDPHSTGTEEDIAAQVATLRELYGAMNEAAAMVNDLEWMRRQLRDLEARLRDLGPAAGAEGEAVRPGAGNGAGPGDGDAAGLAAAADSLERRLQALESELVQLRVTGTGQDNIRWPMRLTGRIAYLAGGVAAGDFPPTDQALEVQALLEERLAGIGARHDALREEVAAFNRTLAERGLSGVVAAP